MSRLLAGALASLLVWATAPVAAGAITQNPQIVQTARPAGHAPEAAHGDGGSARPATVPYVPQSELLCGAAALAMVRRAWGVREVHPGDWAGLVRPEEGGIRTGDLARAAAEDPAPGAGWRVRAGTWRSLPDLGTLLATGPPIALVEDRPGVYHYVVVLQVGADSVRYHDPAVRPDVRVSRTAFDRTWAAADRWALLAVPAPAGPDDSTPSAANPVDPPSEAARAASRHFRAGRFPEAVRAAGDDAPRLRAASLYLAGRPDEALAAWAGIGGARLDLVRVEGLARTRHPVLHDYLELTAGVPLSPAALARAERRLEDLPALAAVRVEYRPVEGGELAEVRARVLERPSLPRTPLDAVAVAAGALADGAVRMGGGLTGAGEWMQGELSWTGARRDVVVRLSAPGVAGLPGIVTVEARRTRESYPDGGETVDAASVAVSDWATTTLRWEAGLRAERRQDHRLRPGAALGVGWTSRDDRVHAGAEATAGGGSGGPWVRGDVEGAVRGGPGVSGRTGVEWRVAAWAAALPSHGPRTARPGAGVGRVRDRLLRAHPLEEDGVVAGPAFAPRLAGATVEVVRWRDGPGPVRIGVAAFVDGVLRRSSSPPGEPSTSAAGLLDAGLGLRADLPGLPGSVRLDAARGLADRAAAVSVGWTAPWPGRR